MQMKNEPEMGLEEKFTVYTLNKQRDPGTVSSDLFAFFYFQASAKSRMPSLISASLNPPKPRRISAD